MSYVFPADLADEIHARWQSFAAHQAAPPLPAPAHLRHILETAFFASFEREEGRAPRFVLCCGPDAAVMRDGEGGTVPLVPLASPRPLTVESVRKLAPAVSPDNAAMLVRCPAGTADAAACAITGVLHIGGHFARARSGRSLYHRPAPFALTVDVRDAGELHIYQGDIKLAAMKAGHLQDQIAFSSLEFLSITDILARGEQALGPAIKSPQYEPPRESSDFEWTALLGTILAVVNGVKTHGHGGTLLLVAPGSEDTLPVRLKYDVGGDLRMLGERFTRFLNARHAVADSRWRERLDPAVRADAMTHAALQSAALNAEVDLGDVADLIARFSAVDGALVLTADLRLIGFGAEIVLDASAHVTAYEAGGHWGISGPRVPVDSESFGMRHRSALRCVGVAESTAAFAVSQDGTVSFFWKLGQEVLLKRNVNTASPSMVGGW
jgi:hypothetical protein